MGSVIQDTIAGNIVWKDSQSCRWYDALGPNVVKVVEDFQYTNLPTADALGAWTTTLVETGAGESTVGLVNGALGGEMIIASDNAENDGVNLQVKGEFFSFAAAYRTYFGIRVKMSEATQSDFLAGLCITDTDLLGGMTDGVYFRKVDGSTPISFVVEKDSVETAIPVATQAADTYAWLEFTVDANNVTAYVDGVKVAQIPATHANFPTDEYLTPSIHFLTGAAAAITCTVDKIVAIQVQA